MTSRKTGDLPHVECIVIDDDTVRYGGDEFMRVRACHKVAWDTIIGEVEGVPACSECNHILGSFDNYCGCCGAKVVEE